ACSDGYQQQVVFTGRPPEAVLLHRRHPREQEGRGVVRSRAAVLEDEGLRWILGGPLQHFRREVDWRRGARRNELPQWKPEVAGKSMWKVVLRERIAADRPWRVGRDIASDNQQQAS